LRDKIFEISENHGDEIVLPISYLRTAGESHHYHLLKYYERKNYRNHKKFKIMKQKSKMKKLLFNSKYSGALLMIIIFAIFFFIAKITAGQSTTNGTNVVLTGVPFLTINTDMRSAGMGDAGVASSPNVNAQHGNAAKYPFLTKDMSVGFSYSPWMRATSQNINLAYLSGYKKIDDDQVISTSLRYFSLGDVIHMSANNEFMGQQSPNEFAVDIAYSRLLTENFSGAVTFRYIRSDITSGQMVNGVESHAGTSGAVDIAGYYYREISRGRRNNVFMAGFSVSNIGTKISYTDGETKDNLPTTLKGGVAYKLELEDYHTLEFAFEASKLLVPTPQIDSLGNFSGVVTGSGFSSDQSVMSGIFSSFVDAPGGFKEEMQEVNLSIGVEYWYNQQFAARVGYFYEHQNKGNRQLLTTGFGLRWNAMEMNFSYIIPMVRHHPLANTLRLGLALNF
jgi:hypothetical protein